MRGGLVAVDMTPFAAKHNWNNKVNLIFPESLSWESASDYPVMKSDCEVVITLSPFSSKTFVLGALRH
jgi:hypothetical protein